MESNEPGRLCGYGTILEYVKDRIKQLRRQQRKTTAETSNHKREPHTDEYGYES
jgi:hypothetical protein